MFEKITRTIRQYFHKPKNYAPLYTSLDFNAIQSSFDTFKNEVQKLLNSDNAQLSLELTRWVKREMVHDILFRYDDSKQYKPRSNHPFMRSVRKRLFKNEHEYIQQLFGDNRDLITSFKSLKRAILNFKGDRNISLPLKSLLTHWVKYKMAHKIVIKDNDEQIKQLKNIKGVKRQSPGGTVLTPHPHDTLHPADGIVIQDDPADGIVIQDDDVNAAEKHDPPHDTLHAADGIVIKDDSGIKGAAVKRLAPGDKVLTKTSGSKRGFDDDSDGEFKASKHAKKLQERLKKLHTNFVTVMEAAEVPQTKPTEISGKNDHDEAIAPHKLTEISGKNEHDEAIVAAESPEMKPTEISGKNDHDEAIDDETEEDDECSTIYIKFDNKIIVLFEVIDIIQAQFLKKFLTYLFQNNKRKKVIVLDANEKEEEGEEKEDDLPISVPSDDPSDMQLKLKLILRFLRRIKSYPSIHPIAFFKESNRRQFTYPYTDILFSDNQSNSDFDKIGSQVINSILKEDIFEVFVFIDGTTYSHIAKVADIINTKLKENGIDHSVIEKDEEDEEDEDDEDDEDAEYDADDGTHKRSGGSKRRWHARSSKMVLTASGTKKKTTRSNKTSKTKIKNGIWGISDLWQSVDYFLDWYY